MNMTDEDYNLMERYLGGLLTSEEVGTFQQRLKSDEAFAEEYQFRKSMTIFQEKEKRKEKLDGIFAELDKEFFPPEPVPIYRNQFVRKLLAMAATVALLVFAWFLFQKESLYEQHVYHPDFSLVERSAGTDLASEAERAYIAKDYREAEHKLRAYLEKDAGNTKVQLALGASLLELDKTGEARSIFTNILKKSPGFKDYAIWYLALTALKEGKLEQAKEHLAKISPSEKKLYEKAQEIIRKE